MQKNFLNIAFFVFLFCLPAYVVRMQFFGLPTTLLEIFFGVLLILWLATYRGMLKDVSLWKGTWRIARGLWVCAATLMIAGVIAIVVAPDTMKALGLFRAYLLEPILFAWMLVWHVQLTRNVQYLLWALGLSSFAVSLYALMQYFFHIQLIAPWDVPGMIRATSVYPYPNAVGLYVAPIVALFSGLAWKRCVQGFRETFFAIVIILSGLGALVASESHGAVAGVFAALIFYSITSRRWKLSVALWVTAIVIATTVSPFADVVLPIITFTDVSGDVRRVLWLGTVRLLGDHGLWGVGLSGFPVAYDVYREARHVELLQYPHNILLNVWVELGLLGVLAFLGLLGASIKKNIDLLFSQTQAFRSAGLVFLGTLLAVIVHGLVDVPFFKNDLAFQFWMILLLPVLISQTVVHSRS